MFCSPDLIQHVKTVAEKYGRFKVRLSLPPANEVCEGYVFTPVCQSFCSQGGIRGMGRAWRGGCEWWGVVRGGGMCVAGWHAWQGVCVPRMPPPPSRYYDYCIRSMSGRYASYWNAFLLNYLSASSELFREWNKMRCILLTISRFQELFVYGTEPIEGFTCFKELLRESNDPDVNTDELVSPDDVVSICFSSGTTGPPKGIMLTHRCLVNNVCMSWWCNFLELHFFKKSFEYCGNLVFS